MNYFERTILGKDVKINYAAELLIVTLKNVLYKLSQQKHMATINEQNIHSKVKRSCIYKLHAKLKI